MIPAKAGFLFPLYTKEKLGYTIIMLNIKTSLKNIPLIRAQYQKVLEKIGLKTVEDFLLYFPFRYDDFSKIVPLEEKYLNEIITVEGKIIKKKLNRIFRRRMTIAEITIQDKNNIPLKAIWFNQPYIYENLKEEDCIRLSGKLALNGKYFSMQNPAWEKSSRDTTNTGRLVPVYSETKGLTSKWIRWQMKMFLEKTKIDDMIPTSVLQKFHLPNLKSALIQIHFPDSQEKLLHAQKRFAFQEMLLIQLKSLQTKSQWEANNSLQIKFNEKLIKKFVSALPFKLTDAQRKSSFEILKDLEKSRPMNRLLNGDVGSGKTIIAAISSLEVLDAGYQVALMAPTEVLARQHFEKFCELFKKYNFNISLLTNSYKLVCHSKLSCPLDTFGNSKSSQKNKDTSLDSRLRGNDNKTRNELLSEIKSGRINLVIGTHALIQKDVKFKNLALIIIDEQHRFGVAQRAYLQHTIQTDTDLTQTNTEFIYKDLTYKLRGCFFAIKKELGLGHKEAIYQKAFFEELTKNNLSFEKEVYINIKYNNKKIGTYRPDFIVENKIIVELKALPSIGKFEKQQVWHYLKGSQFKLALLVNFGREDIEIERFIHTKNQHRSEFSRHKSVSVPHLLTMTATPIPRTLSIAFSGNLDISVLDEMPKNRKKIITKIISPQKRNSAYEFIRQQIKSGRQVFVILPLVEDSKIMTEVKAAVSEHSRLSKEIFPEFNLGLLHGKLKAKEKEKIMQDFSDRKLNILVSTSVVEVGIDIPNATVMVIEDADRFGLSQLHQFRGRVGRSEHQSYCFLFTNSDTLKSVERLRALESTNDGFKIAEKDLELRGPGQFFGTIQSGLPDIAMENLTNIKLIKFARAEAKEILKSDLELKKHPLLKNALQKFQEKIHLE